jgi:hypothetical protein
MPASVNCVKRILAFFFVLWLQGMPSALLWAETMPAANAVVVIGTGSVESNNVQKAREDAIDNGLISALELAVAQIIALDLEINNFEKINEFVYNRSEQFVQVYKVLTEAMSGKNYRVLVEVTVSNEALKDALTRAGAVQGQKSLPVILLMISEQNIDDLSPRYWWGSGMELVKPIAETAMAATFREKGFSILDHETALTSPMRERMADIPEPDNQLVTELASRLNADVVIVGKSFVVEQTSSDASNSLLFSGKISARAVRTDTGQEIASVVQMAEAIHSDEIAGGRKVLSEAGSRAAEALSSQIVALWRGDVSGVMRLKLMVKGTRYLANFVQFRKILREVAGVLSVQTREMKPDESTLLVEFQGNTEAFADALMAQTYDSFGINIYETTQDTLKVELIPG